MGREVRMVPKDWKHPVNEWGNPIALFGNYRKAIAEFNKLVKEHDKDYAIDYFGSKPTKKSHMCFPPKAKLTHYMMYETCSEGTPMSPAFETPEELAHWLTDNQASTWANLTTTYESWLEIIKSGEEYIPLLSVKS